MEKEDEEEDDEEEEEWVSRTREVRMLVEWGRGGGVG